LSEQMSFACGHEHRIREQVVHGLQSCASGLTPGRDLYRRRLASEHREAVTAHVAHAVDQNIDAVGANLLGELIVGKSGSVAPRMDTAVEPGSYVIRICSIRVADHIELTGIMTEYDATKRISSSLVSKVAANICNAQTAIGVDPVVMRSNQ